MTLTLSYSPQGLRGIGASLALIVAKKYRMVINYSRHAIKHLKQHLSKQDKNIVNLLSIASKSGAPHQYLDYAISKAAVETLTIGLTYELANDQNWQMIKFESTESIQE